MPLRYTALNFKDISKMQNKFERLDIGAVGLVQETEDGRIRQIGLTEAQSKMLQVLVASMSNGSPLLQMGEEYDLVLANVFKTK
jgi:hypothetical protein